MDVQKTAVGKSNKSKILSNKAYKNTEARLRVFLEDYAQHGRVLRACKTAGIDFGVHYARLKSDVLYREAFEAVEQQAAQRIEDKVYTWAVEDDLQAAIVLLKRFRPNLYRERASVDITAEITVSEALAEARNRVIELERHDRTGTEG